MSIRLSNKCDECGKGMKKFHLYKNKSLCGMCYRRQFLIIPSILIEPTISTVVFTLGLTRTQKKLLDERVNYLFPKKKNCRIKYLKALMLGDIENWRNNKKGE